MVDGQKDGIFCKHFVNCDEVKEKKNIKRSYVLNIWQKSLNFGANFFFFDYLSDKRRKKKKKK